MITDSAIEIKHQRAWFWFDIMTRLDDLTNRVSEADRRRIEAAVAKKASRPTREEYDKLAQEVRENFGVQRGEWKWS